MPGCRHTRQRHPHTDRLPADMMGGPQTPAQDEHGGARDARKYARKFPSHHAKGDGETSAPVHQRHVAANNRELFQARHMQTSGRGFAMPSHPINAFDMCVIKAHFHTQHLDAFLHCTHAHEALVTWQMHSTWTHQHADGDMMSTCLRAEPQSAEDERLCSCLPWCPWLLDTTHTAARPPKRGAPATPMPAAASRRHRPGPPSYSRVPPAADRLLIEVLDSG